MTTFDVISLLPPGFLEDALRTDAYAGLTRSPKRLPPKWFYDDRGSELFELITRLPEYYPTRAESAILRARAGDIASASRARTLVELGSGSADKTVPLLDALRDCGSLLRYVPVDVSKAALLAAGRRVRAAHPGLSVLGIVSDFEEHLDLPATQGPRLVAFLGSTIGNLEPADRACFLTSLRAGLISGDSVLLGTDLVKDPATLIAAYDDAAGVTAAFNKNVLNVLNRELDADFDLDAFAHVAVWDSASEWIEMRLRSLTEQTVKLGVLGIGVVFAEGEEMRTEVSAKFRKERLQAELTQAGFTMRSWWTDPEGRFALSLSLVV